MLNKKTLSTLVLGLMILFSTVINAQLPDSLAKRFQYTPVKNMQYKVDSAYSISNVQVKRITYMSTDSFIVSAFLVLPSTKGKTPLIIFQHWGEGNKSEFLTEAIEFAKNGISCILPDAVWLCPKSTIVSFKKNGYDLYRQGVMNIMTAIDLAGSNLKVDYDKVCYVGHSYGCNLGAILSAIEKRINNFVFMAGVYSTTKSVSNSKEADFVEWRKKSPDEFKAWIRKMRPLDAELYLPYKKAPCIIQVAEQDEYVTMDENNKFINITPQPKLVQKYKATHKLNSQAQFRRKKWILTKLK